MTDYSSGPVSTLEDQDTSSRFAKSQVEDRRPLLAGVEPDDSTPVSAAFNRLNHLHFTLDQEIAQLTRRIEPALGPHGGTKESNDKDGRRPTSQVVAGLDSASSLVQEMIEAVRSLNERIEL